MAGRTDLTAGQDDSNAQLLDVMLQLLPDRLRTADDGEDTFFDVAPGLLRVEKVFLVFQNRGGRLGRGISRRRQANALEQVAREVPEGLLELLPCLFVGLRHV